MFEKYNEQIRSDRHSALSGLLAEQGLRHVVILQPGLENLDLWLLGQEGLPTPAPFNRNSAYIFGADGAITKLCQTTTHPTDRAQFPHFEDTDLSAVFDGAPVGIVNPAYLKKNVRDHLAKAYPAFRFVDVTGAFYQCKAVKSPAEIEALRTAAAEYDRLFTAMPLLLRPERLEKEAVNEIRQRMMWQGAESETPGFHTMVQLTSAPDGGPSAQEPLPWPGRRLQTGDRVNVSVRGYFSNGCAAALGRSFVLGPVSAQTGKDWETAVFAQEMAASMAKPGATLREISGAVNACLTQQGYQPLNSAWIHGVGTSAYEAPRNVDATADAPLKAGMVLAIGPEVRRGGADALSCLDVFVVTENGAERLSKTAPVLRQL